MTAKGKELKPLFDLLKDTNVGIAPFVDLHGFKNSLELLALFFHVVSLGLFPSVIEVTLEDGLAISDVIPEALHEGNFVMDLCDLILGGLDGVRVLELRSVVLEFISATLEIMDLSVHGRKTIQRRLTASIITVEVTLLHGSNESLELFLVLDDHGNIALALLVAKRSNFFLDVPGELLEVSPLVEQLGRRLDLLVLRDTISLEELERLVELIEQKGCLIIFTVDNLHGILDGNEVLDYTEILLLNRRTGSSFLHESLQLLDLLLDILDQGGAGQMVVLGLRRGREARGVRGAANCLPGALVVLVGNLDIKVALLVNTVLNVVLAIV